MLHILATKYILRKIDFYNFRFGPFEGFDFAIAQSFRRLCPLGSAKPFGRHFSSQAPRQITSTISLFAPQRFRFGSSIIERSAQLVEQTRASCLASSKFMIQDS